MEPEKALEFLEAIPLQQVRVVLRLTRPVRFHFFHGPVIHGLLCRAFGGHLPSAVIPFPSESGRVHFEAGETYRIGVTLFGSGKPALDALATSLRAIGENGETARGESPVLGGNFTLADIQTQTVGARGLNPGQEPTAIRFITPFRRDRPRELQLPGHKAMDALCFPADHFLSGLWARLGDLGEGKFRNPWPTCPSPLPELAVSSCSLHWLDAPVKGRDRVSKGRPQGFTLGGVVGHIRFEGLDQFWRRCLALGQFVHVGQKIHFGMGRYVLDDQWRPDEDFFAPSRSMVDALKDQANLETALDHIVSRSTAPGIDGLAPQEAASQKSRFLGGLKEALDQKSYHPQPLLGFLAPKKKGGFRPLAIPTVADRCLQRVLVQMLGPSIDALLEDCSFAYRKGFSRRGAAQAISRAYDDGYRHVLETDLLGFFDHVDQNRIVEKFRSFFPYSQVDDLIAAWIGAPVVFKGETIPRPLGLPQGAPISPLLANLFLDELDEELLGRNYRLVRFADDFVILCRSLQEARTAQVAVEEAVARMGLELNRKKTRITNLDQGVHFLGYLFLKSLVLESENTAESQGANAPLAASEIPSAWLQHVDLNNATPMVSRHDHEALKKGIVRFEDLGGEPDGKAEGLYLFRSDQEIHLRGESIEIRGPDGPPRQFPIREISHLVSCGRTRLTVPVLAALARRKIPTYLCHRSGELDVAFEYTEPDHGLIMAQARAAEDEQTRLEFARGIIRAKLHNQATLVVRYDLGDARKASGLLRHMERRCSGAGSVEEIMGCEGAGARAFFAAIGAGLHAAWGFSGRKKNPPPDPVNAMLSYGYTILYHHISTALLARGLNPRLGIMHHERGAYHALACDIQEEFRFLVEAYVLGMIHKNMASPSDFAPSWDGKYPCLMNRDLRHKFIMGLESRFADSFTPAGFEEPVSYQQFFFHQARLLADFLVGRVAGYKPLRLHA